MRVQIIDSTNNFVRSSDSVRPRDGYLEILLPVRLGCYAAKPPKRSIIFLCLKKLTNTLMMPSVSYDEEFGTYLASALSGYDQARILTSRSGIMKKSFGYVYIQYLSQGNSY